MNELVLWICLIGLCTVLSVYSVLHLKYLYETGEGSLCSNTTIGCSLVSELISILLCTMMAITSELLDVSNYISARILVVVFISVAVLLSEAAPSEAHVCEGLKHIDFDCIQAAVYSETHPSTDQQSAPVMDAESPDLSYGDTGNWVKSGDRPLGQKSAPLKIAANVPSPETMDRYEADWEEMKLQVLKYDEEREAAFTESMSSYWEYFRRAIDEQEAVEPEATPVTPPSEPIHINCGESGCKIQQWKAFDVNIAHEQWVDFEVKKRKDILEKAMTPDFKAFMIETLNDHVNQSSLQGGKCCVTEFVFTSEVTDDRLLGIRIFLHDTYNGYDTGVYRPHFIFTESKQADEVRVAICWEQSYLYGAQDLAKGYIPPGSETHSYLSTRNSTVSSASMLALSYVLRTYPLSVIAVVGLIMLAIIGVVGQALDDKKKEDLAKKKPETRTIKSD